MANDWHTLPRTGLMIAVQNQVISTSNYKKHILNDPNTTKDISKIAQSNTWVETI
jgi:hypothetical protein